MFEEFNKILKMKLIALYDSFIKNPQDKTLQANAATITQKYANSGEYNLKPEIDLALGKSI